MYTLHSAGLPPDHVELSRHAAERYAVLTAVKERRAQAASRLASPDASSRPCRHHSRSTTRSGTGDLS